MPKLIVNIGLMPRQLTLSQLEVACSLTDELCFSVHVGDHVLLAHTLGDDEALSVFAIAKLDRFTSENNETRALFSNLVVLTEEIRQPNNARGLVFSYSADESAVLRQDSVTPQTPGNEAFSVFSPSTGFTPLEVFGQIGQQVRDTAHSVCAFSGVSVRPSDGAATPIRPVDTGGQIHVRNFIFLHDEPAHLFNRFAWTVGPDFEIIVDAWSVGTSVLSTVNSSGKLVVGDDQRYWPDETALAWHRQKFLERLR